MHENRLTLPPREKGERLTEMTDSHARSHEHIQTYMRSFQTGKKPVLSGPLLVRVRGILGFDIHWPIESLLQWNFREIQVRT